MVAAIGSMHKTYNKGESGQPYLVLFWIQIEGDSC